MALIEQLKSAEHMSRYSMWRNKFGRKHCILCEAAIETGDYIVGYKDTSTAYVRWVIICPVCYEHIVGGIKPLNDNSDENLSCKSAPVNNNNKIKEKEMKFQEQSKTPAMPAIPGNLPAKSFSFGGTPITAKGMSWLRYCLKKWILPVGIYPMQKAA